MKVPYKTHRHSHPMFRYKAVTSSYPGGVDLLGWTFTPFLSKTGTHISTNPSKIFLWAKVRVRLFFSKTYTPHMNWSLPNSNAA